MKTTQLGIHLLFDFYDCDTQLLNDPSRLEDLLKKTAQAANLTPLKGASHQFKPQGASAFILVAESHIAIHTWPEYGYAAVDVFSCRLDVDEQKLQTLLCLELQAQRSESRCLNRGEISELNP